MSSQDFYDRYETQDAEAREAALLAALPKQIATAQKKAPFYAKALAEVDARAVTSRAALAQLPVTRKSALVELQRSEPPLGGLAAVAESAILRFYGSPGPIYEFETGRADFWRMARALFAAGFRKGERLHNCFAYHLTPGGWMLDSGARALGCSVVPGGVGNSEQQVEAIAQLRPNGYSGTPDFLKVLLDKAMELRRDISSLKKALVSGAALPASLRSELEARGVKTRQCYATADLGLIAYESDAADGMIVAEEILVEILRPGTGDPIPEREVGEVVVTSLNPDYPLIRFATGDLSAVLPGQSSCGRSNLRLKGWMGRADQTAKVKGMFVHPGQVAAAVKRHPEVKRARLVVERVGESDVMTLHCEVAGGDPALEAAIAKSLQEACKVKGAVALVAPGSLANDGKVIEDRRPTG
ncbi:MAG: phenylacetate--CoA ligase family protein [Kiloniellales bacterium]